MTSKSRVDHMKGGNFTEFLPKIQRLKSPRMWSTHASPSAKTEKVDHMRGDFRQEIPGPLAAKSLYAISLGRAFGPSSRTRPRQKKTETALLRFWLHLDNVTLWPSIASLTVLAPHKLLRSLCWDEPTARPLGPSARKLKTGFARFIDEKAGLVKTMYVFMETCFLRKADPSQKKSTFR